LIFSFEAKPSKIIEISSKISSKNHQKTIVLLEKKQEILPKSWIFMFFQAKRSLFDDFLIIFR